MMQINKWLLLPLLILLFYVIGVGILYLLQNKILFQPVKLSTDYKFQFEQPFKEYFLKTSEGIRLNALFFKTEENRKGVVLYFHGNADNLQRWGRYMVDFTSRGYDVFVIDYRGFGKSEGRPEETALYADAYKAYQQLTKTYTAQEIIIYGRSLGTAVATELATQVQARMLILETPFNSIRGVLEAKAPFLYLPFRLRSEFPVDQHIQHVPYPIQIIQGDQDKIVPLQSAEKLKPLLKKTDKFMVIKGGEHKNLRTFESYQLLLDRLLGIDEFREE